MFWPKAILATLLFFSAVPLGFSQTNEDWAWMDEHFQSTLDALLPLDQPIGALVIYRSHRDLYTDVPEYSLSIQQHNENNGKRHYLTARILVPDSQSLYSQMMALHRKYPDRPASEVRGELRLQTWSVTETDCPALTKQFTKLRELRFGIPLSDEIVLHPLIHEFRFRGLAGDMKIVIDDQSHALAKWATETKQALAPCTVSSQKR